MLQQTSSSVIYNPESNVWSASPEQYFLEPVLIEENEPNETMELLEASARNSLNTLPIRPY
jgi:hypothetical protein